MSFTRLGQQVTGAIQKPKVGDGTTNAGGVLAGVGDVNKDEAGGDGFTVERGVEAKPVENEVLARGEITGAGKPENGGSDKLDLGQKR